MAAGDFVVLTVFLVWPLQAFSDDKWEALIERISNDLPSVSAYAEYVNQPERVEALKRDMPVLEANDTVKAYAHLLEKERHKLIKTVLDEVIRVAKEYAAKEQDETSKEGMAMKKAMGHMLGGTRQKPRRR